MNLSTLLSFLSEDDKEAGKRSPRKGFTISYRLSVFILLVALGYGQKSETEIHQSSDAKIDSLRESVIRLEYYLKSNDTRISSIEQLYKIQKQDQEVEIKDLRRDLEYMRDRLILARAIN